MKKGDKVKLKPGACFWDGEHDLVFELLTDPNTNNRVDIRWIDDKNTFPAIESASVKMLEVING